MGDIHYMISEAAKDVGVESHVLRYWEEELDMAIGRTEMGHRYYTEEDIQLFKCIRKLKEEGVLLKELKVLIPDIQKAKQYKASKKVDRKVDKKPASRLEQALRQNNAILQEEICRSVTQSLKKEMSYLLDAKEQLEEDRYRRLDTLIRQQQIQRKESAKRGVSVLVKQVLGVS